MTEPSASVGLLLGTVCWLISVLEQSPKLITEKSANCDHQWNLWLLNEFKFRVDDSV